MSVLLRSRSLMRGTFHPDRHGADGSHDSVPACVITHAASARAVAAWDAAPPSRGGRSDAPPPPVDDGTPLDRARRSEIAAAHGHVYDEATGPDAVLEALTARERARLADDRMPLRHYRAEKGNLPEAIRKIRATLRWREEFDVEDIRRCCDGRGLGAGAGAASPDRQKKRNALADVIARENETGKIYCRGYDREGRAILYLTPGKENSTAEYDNMRHLVYHLERAIACTRAKSGREKICIVIGFHGFRLTNAPPLATTRHTLAILQGHYPERMHRAYICDPPLAFRTFWRIVKHFVDETTLEKIAFCAGPEGRGLLERDFDTATTERQAGGTDDGLREYDSREFLFGTPFDCTFDEKWE